LLSFSGGASDVLLNLAQDQIDFYPGMPAEVMIATGERTFFEYLIAPVARSFRRAFRED